MFHVYQTNFHRITSFDDVRRVFSNQTGEVLMLACEERCYVRRLGSGGTGHAGGRSELGGGDAVFSYHCSL